MAPNMQVIAARLIVAAALVLAIAGCAPGPDTGPPPAPSPTALSPASSPAPTSEDPAGVARTYPDGPLPPAADGTHVEACRDGRCQILVKGHVMLTVGSERFSITVRDRQVTVEMPNGFEFGLARPDDHASFQSANTQGKKVTIRAAGIREDEAVLNIESG